MDRKGIYQTKKTGTIRNGPDPCRENLFLMHAGDSCDVGASQRTGSSPRCHLRSHYLVCIKNHLFIVGTGPILNKVLQFIYRFDCSDRTCIYSQVSVLSDNYIYTNITKSALFFSYKNIMQSVWTFVYKNVTQSALYFAYKNMMQSAMFFAYTKCPPPMAISKIL